MSREKKSTGLPKGIRQLANGRYEARAQVNKKSINLYGKDLNALIQEFEDEKEKARTGSQYAMRNFTLNEWFELWFRDVKSKKLKAPSVKDIMPLDIQGVLNAMEANGASTNTMNTALGRVRECFDFAIGNRLVKTNPCLAVVVPWVYKQTKEEIALTQKEQDAFLEVMEGNWYKELFYFMCLTGVRVGELGGLKWKDIDFTRKKIRISRSLSCNYVDGTKTEMLVPPKTANSVREIPFMGEMEEILKSQREKQKKLKADLGERWRSKGEFDNLVFTTSMGSTCTRYIVEKEIKKAIKELRNREAYQAMEEKRAPKEIRDFHPHSLRHTFATNCVESGVDMTVLQKWLGHKSITMTIDRYTHISEDYKKQEQAKVKTILLH